MSTNITGTNDIVEYHGIAHSQIMTQLTSENDGENRPELAARDENGKFLPGHTANPNGRPRTASISEAYKEILRRDGALKYAETIARDAVEAKNARDRLAAASEMTDRTDGKATQRMDLRGVFMVTAPAAELVQTIDAWADE